MTHHRLDVRVHEVLRWLRQPELGNFKEISEEQPDERDVALSKT
jgi:hypothetical protein